MGMHPVPPRIASASTLAVCWAVQNASRVGTQTRSHVFRVAPNGWQETGFRIQRRWQMIFQGHCRGGVVGGGRCTAIR